MSVTPSLQSAEFVGPNFTRLGAGDTAFQTAQASVPTTTCVDLFQLPLSFEANQGQTDAAVFYLSRGPGYGLFLTPSGPVLNLRQSVERASVRALESSGDGDDETVNRRNGEDQNVHRRSSVVNAGTLNSQLPKLSTALQMQLLGANQAPRIAGVDQQSGVVNYFLGNDSSHWRTNVATYAKVKYEQVYPGIDLVFYGNQRQLEYDFIIAPGTDPKLIQLAFDGADSVEVDANGELVLRIGESEVRQRKPVIYQMINGERREIEGGYVLAPVASGQLSVASDQRAELAIGDWPSAIDEPSTLSPQPSTDRSSRREEALILTTDYADDTDSQTVGTHSTASHFSPYDVGTTENGAMETPNRWFSRRPTAGKRASQGEVTDAVERVPTGTLLDRRPSAPSVVSENELSTSNVQHSTLNAQPSTDHEPLTTDNWQLTTAPDVPTLNRSTLVTFRVASYDPAHPLIIDPVWFIRPISAATFQFSRHRPRHNLVLLLLLRSIQTVHRPFCHRTCRTSSRSGAFKRSSRTVARPMSVNPTMSGPSARKC